VNSGEPRAPRLQCSCLRRTVHPLEFIAVLGPVDDPVVILGDMVNVKFRDSPQIVRGPAPPQETQVEPGTVARTVRSAVAGTSAKRLAASGREGSACDSPGRHGGPGDRILGPTGCTFKRGQREHKGKQGEQQEALCTRPGGTRGCAPARPVAPQPPKEAPGAGRHKLRPKKPGTLLLSTQGSPEQPGFQKASEPVGNPRQSGSGVPSAGQGGFCADPLDLLPAQELISVSEQTKNSLLGAAPYLGVHWRRGDFGVYCFFHSPYPDACFYSPAQAGKCAFHVANSLGLRGLSLCHERARSRGEYQASPCAPSLPPKASSLLLRRGFCSPAEASGQMRGQSVSLLTPCRSRGSKRSWESCRADSLELCSSQPPSLAASTRACGSPSQRRGLVAGSQEGSNASRVPSWDSQHKVVGLTLEKLVAARSQVFLGSIESTFTKGIQEMREAFGSRNSNDSYVCFRELEWSIFDGLPEDLHVEKKRRLKNSARREHYRKLREAQEKLRRRRERTEKRKAGLRS